MIKNGTHLFQRNPRKPLDKLWRGSSVLKILKQRGNGNPRAAEYPSSADTFRVTLHCRTIRPIDHVQDSTTTGTRRLRVRSRLTSQNWRPDFDQIRLRPIEQTGGIALPVRAVSVKAAGGA